jgi:PAS domain S-box-containing protein
VCGAGQSGVSSNGASPILVVDDDRKNLAALETVLAPLGHEVVTAASGEEALRQLLLDDFAVILMDVRMPTLDGFETVELIKRRKRNQDTAVIFLTGVEKDARQVFRGYSAGAVDYISKPVDTDVLRSKVSVLVDLHRKTDALKESEERFRTAFANAPIGIALIGPEGEWLQANEALCEMLGRSSAELFQRPICEFTRPADREHEQREFRRLIAEKPRFYQAEKCLVHRDGRVVRALVSVSLAIDAQARPLNFIWQLVDITELERRADDLARSNAELEQYAYVISHDLQEPLRSIGGFVQLLERRYQGALDDEADRFIGFTVAGVERMQALIDDLLSYSRAGAGELRGDQVDTRELVNRTLTSLDAAVREAGAQVKVGELPTIVADESALGQVFQNLLSNAIKFRAGDPPRVEVSATHADDARTFAVADSGIGVEPAHAERIFRIFQRLHTRDEYGGTGVGLAICKRIVERHGGRIWCESRPGGGTVFRFTIPDAEARR